MVNIAANRFDDSGGLVKLSINQEEICLSYSPYKKIKTKEV